MNAKSEALIIGAGPVGLCMGLALAKQGVSFRIIDSALAPVKESRAIGIQARTLEIFEMMGMVNEFLDLGHQLHGVTIYGQSGAKIAHLDMRMRSMTAASLSSRSSLSGSDTTILSVRTWWSRITS